MAKFLRFKNGENTFIFNLEGIVTVLQGSAKTTLVYSSEKGVGQLAVVFGTPSLSSAEQTAQKDAMILAISEALIAPWTQPFHTFTLPNALNGDPDVTSF